MVSIVSDASKLGDKAYDPSPITISQGDIVVWVNNDFGIHTVTENNNIFSSQDLRPDETFEYMFDKSGSLDYHCKLHPTMIGKVIVNQFFYHCLFRMQCKPAAGWQSNYYSNKLKEYKSYLRISILQVC